MTLESKRVVVVGGTSGIGLATAHAAAKEGAEVIVASANQARVGEAAAGLPAGSTGRLIDVTDGAAVETFFAEVGELDHLVYTAGESLLVSPLRELDLDQARRFFDVRYFGALRTVQVATPRIRPGGSVTLTTGAASARPRAGWSIGASVCGAVGALTRALAVELAPIRVNVVSPGVVRSPLWSPMDDADRQQLYQTAAASLPVGHVGETDELALAYLYCMHQTFATGTAITVDGGSVLV
jgi:NAD(P)-dependent dehydrogenase (short-subunit alcohol dehydrogenase family)